MDAQTQTVKPPHATTAGFVNMSDRELKAHIEWLKQHRPKWTGDLASAEDELDWRLNRS